MINVVKSLATVILLTFSIPALAQVDELPALGIRAVYDSATGIVEITQSGVAAAQAADPALSALKHHVLQGAGGESNPALAAPPEVHGVSMLYGEVCCTVKASCVFPPLRRP